MSADEQVSQTQEAATNAIAAICIGAGVALLIIYALLVAFSSSESETGALIRKWCHWLPWIPKQLQQPEHSSMATGMNERRPLKKKAETQQGLALTRKQREIVRAAREGLKEVREARYRFGDVLAKEADWARRSVSQNLHETINNPGSPGKGGRKVTFRMLQESVAAESGPQKSKRMSQGGVADFVIRRDAQHVANLDKIGQV